MFGSPAYSYHPPSSSYGSPQSPSNDYDASAPIDSPGSHETSPGSRGRISASPSFLGGKRENNNLDGGPVAKKVRRVSDEQVDIVDKYFFVVQPSFATSRHCEVHRSKIKIAWASPGDVVSIKDCAAGRRCQEANLILVESVTGYVGHISLDAIDSQNPLEFVCPFCPAGSKRYVKENRFIFHLTDNHIGDKIKANIRSTRGPYRCFTHNNCHFTGTDKRKVIDHFLDPKSNHGSKNIYRSLIMQCLRSRPSIDDEYVPNEFERGQSIDVDSMKVKCEALQKAADNAKNSRHQAEEESSELRREIVRLKSSMNSGDNAAKLKKAEMEILNDKLSRKESETTSLRNELDNLKNQQPSQAETINKLREELAKHRDLNKRLTKRLEGCLTSSGPESAGLAVARQKLAITSIEVESLKQEAAESALKAKSLEKEIGSLKQRLASSADSEKRLRKDLEAERMSSAMSKSARDTDVEAKKKLSSDFRSKMSVANGKIASLKQEAEASKATIEQLKRKIDELKQTMEVDARKSEDERTQIEAELKRTKKAGEMSNRKYEKVHAANEKLLAEKKEAELRCEKLAGDLEAAGKAAEDTEKKYAEEMASLSEDSVKTKDSHFAETTVLKVKVEAMERTEAKHLKQIDDERAKAAEASRACEELQAKMVEASKAEQKNLELEIKLAEKSSELAEIDDAKSKMAAENDKLRDELAKLAPLQFAGEDNTVKIEIHADVGEGTSNNKPDEALPNDALHERLTNDLRARDKRIERMRKKLDESKQIGNDYAKLLVTMGKLEEKLRQNEAKIAADAKHLAAARKIIRLRESEIEVLKGIDANSS